MIKLSFNNMNFTILKKIFVRTVPFIALWGIGNAIMFSPEEIYKKIGISNIHKELKSKFIYINPDKRKISKIVNDDDITQLFPENIYDIEELLAECNDFKQKVSHYFSDLYTNQKKKKIYINTCRLKNINVI